MKTLTIIGSGQVAKTLGYLFSNQGLYDIKQIYSRQGANTSAAREFIQAGQVVNNVNELVSTDVYLLAVPDDQLPTVSRQLSNLSILKQNDIVFHCSGALTSDVLSELKSRSVCLASMHPIKDFSDAQNDVKNFAGIYCSLEGDSYACQQLEQDFTALGANIIHLTPSQKLLYHTANVIASNYLVALIEAACITFDSIGIDQGQALELLQPIVQSVCKNIFTKGTHKALTGPINRGDSNTVHEELEALQVTLPHIADVYQSLGKVALQIVRQKGSLSDEMIGKLEEALM